ncbi:MAG: hypothetical protein MSA27_04215 [Spirochaetia bacterium]|nr:hypothetical protein [Spirochaetia bacterium]
MAMRLLSYESVTADKAQEKITLEENASKYKSTKISSKNITLPGWRELSLSVDSSLEARGIDFYNPSSNLFYRCPRCLEIVVDGRCENCEDNFDIEELVEDCFYLRFSLILDEGDEVIYRSGLVAPDLHIQSVNLTRVLESGDYSARVLIEPYGKDMATPLNKGEVKLTLHVKNLT